MVKEMVLGVGVKFGQEVWKTTDDMDNDFWPAECSPVSQPGWHFGQQVSLFSHSRPSLSGDHPVHPWAGFVPFCPLRACLESYGLIRAFVVTLA